METMSSTMKMDGHAGAVKRPPEHLTDDELNGRC